MISNHNDNTIRKEKKKKNTSKIPPKNYKEHPIVDN